MPYLFTKITRPLVRYLLHTGRQSSMVWYYMVLLFVSSCFSAVNGQSYRIIDSASGPVRGIGVQNQGKMMYQYRKIPYAKPPVGYLRLRKPVPFGRWTNVLDGSSFGPSCYQRTEYIFPTFPNSEMSEDCLHLNVYTPDNASPSNTKSVMIWIHGGGYTSGQSFAYDASNLVTLGDVVVVTVNYRLGILGFLSTMDNASRGNYGLWDQRLAMQWVKDNIRAFGGDPNYITIFGESAGGFSVGIHALIAENQGLFQRVIAESGTGNAIFAFSLEPQKYARGYGIHLNCVNESELNFDTEQLIECFRQKSAKEIMEAQINGNVSKYSDYILSSPAAPVVDGDLIKQHPNVIIANTSSTESSFFRSLDVMIGNTNSEGSLLYDEHMISLEKQYHFNYSRAIPTAVLCNAYAPDIAKDLYNSNSEVSDAICKQYSRANELQQSRSIVDMYTDVIMVAPAVKSLECHSLPGPTMGRNTYQYMFTREYKDTSYPQPSWFKGAWHAAEIPYLFGPRLTWPVSKPSTQGDVMLADSMIKYWTNFAKRGSPNGPGLPYWPRYDSVGRLYQTLDINIAPAYNVNQKRIGFWNHYLPTLVRKTANINMAVG